MTRERELPLRAWADERDRRPRLVKCIAISERSPEKGTMSLKPFTVFDTGHIDGGAYRAVKLADGSARTEEWRGGKWVVPGDATFGEIADAPPVGPGFAHALGIPLSNLGPHANSRGFFV